MKIESRHQLKSLSLALIRDAVRRKKPYYLEIFPEHNLYFVWLVEMFTKCLTFVHPKRGSQLEDFSGAQSEFSFQ